MSATTDWPDATRKALLVNKLAQFRESLEDGTESPISALQINAAILLSDLCRLIGLDDQQHDHVLGETGAEHLLEVLETRVWLRSATTQEFAEPVVRGLTVPHHLQEDS